MRDLLFPAVCVGCANECSPENYFFCRRCFRLIGVECQGLQLITEHHYFFDYRCFSKQILKTAKVKPSFRHYQSLLALIKNADCTMLNNGDGVDAIVPIPAKFSSLFFRGFSPAHEYAKILSEFTYAPVKPWLQYRQYIFGAVKKQSRLTRKQRQKNIEGVFKASRSVATKKILLVDDIVTTGATLTEAKATLFQAGAAHVQTISLAATRSKW